MQTSFLKRLLLMTLVGTLGAPVAMAAEQVQEWKLVAPNGIIEKASIAPAPRINTLDNKTIVLRWNGKNNGNLFLDRIAVNLAKKVPSARVIKAYEKDPSINGISGNVKESARVTASLKSMTPDIIIAAQAD